MEMITGLVFAVVGYVIYVLLGYKNGWSNKHPLSPIGIPIVGHPFHLLNTNHSSSTRLSGQLGGSYMLKLFHMNFLFLTTWADVKEAMINQADVFSLKLAPTDEKITSLAGITFLFLDGPIWKEKRRFTLHHLRNFGFGKKLMENTILEEFDRVSDFLDRQRTMSFNNFFFCPFLNVLWGIVAGKTYEFGDEELKRVSSDIKSTFALAKMGIIVGIIPLFKHLPGDPFGNKECQRYVESVKDFIEKEVDEHVKSFSDGEPRDYMDAYLAEIRKLEGNELTEENVCYQRRHLVGAIYDILQAGVETTATTLEWSLLYMATWPEIQKKVQDELDTVVGRNRRTAYSDNAMLPYVKATLMEVQRYCTVVPLCSPRVTKWETTLNNYTIPARTIVILNLYAVHRDKQLWGDPEVFRPERFLMTDEKADKTDGWIPFSLGPRICLGEALARMELFLYFTGLLQKYSFHLLPSQPPPSLVPGQSLTLQPQPFKLAIHKR